MDVSRPQVPRTWTGWLLRWFAWTLVTWASGKVGLVVGGGIVLLFWWSVPPEDIPVWFLLSGELLGTGGAVGVGQWLLLRRWLPHAGWWIPATAAGTALGGWTPAAVAVAVGRWAQIASFWAPAAGMLASASAGAPQWLYLRNRVAGAIWWIPASIAAWGGSALSGLGLRSLGSALQAEGWAAQVVGAQFLGEAIRAAITGAALLFLLSRTARAQPQPSHRRTFLRRVAWALGLMLIAASFLVVLARPWLGAASAPGAARAPSPTPVVAGGVAPMVTPAAQPPTPTQQPNAAPMVIRGKAGYREDCCPGSRTGEFQSVYVGAWKQGWRQGSCGQTLGAADGSFILSVPATCFKEGDTVWLTAGGHNACPTLPFRAGASVEVNVKGSPGIADCAQPAVSGATSPTSALAPNLAPNPSFELGVGGPTGWRQDVYVYRKQAWETAVAHSGQRAISTTYAQCGGWRVWWANDAPIGLQAGARYRLSVWVRSEGPRRPYESVWIGLSKGPGITGDIGRRDFIFSPDWQQVAQVFQIPADVTGALIELGYTGGDCNGSLNTVYFDDVELRLVP